MFSRAEIEQFRSEGWLAAHDFWNEREVAAMRAELERLKSRGLLRNVATAGDGVTPASEQVNLQLCPMFPHSALFRAMPFADKATAAVQQLIGDPVVLHLDQVFLKPGRQGSGTNWHQDNAYFQIDDPLKGTAMWTAVHAATIANGTIHVIPGSFRTVYPHSRDPYSDHHIRCYPPEDDALAIELPAGGVAFFAYGVAHCTLANKTDAERAGVALHFINGGQDATAKSGFPLGKRPYLTGAAASGGLNEHGALIAGSWEREVSAALAQF
ncbi:MAG: phytanoyl-CoA dioxygenase family protein [Chloroflexi bacterium]|nr:phytanoyl-CoA dioxygenase family protein [Chloroflexota bacterium]MCY3582712.1 phytanoyl-CoA dioxygenase family protein [Chloroflexota bacterium]MCY3717575.1 phytanoyl-CoA dioxygenase family protein [Chloroflexota bacterium]MDE2651992.1 phytanoyl-CoA dioxygenase family protein [Chloroflexota bacterium]MXV93698.1 phytanoyl-CoA dioxygenase family protein [Chloroflexota bacterium]